VESKELKDDSFQKLEAVTLQNKNSEKTPAHRLVTWCLKCRLMHTAQSVLVYWKVRIPHFGRSTLRDASSHSLHYEGWMPGIVPGAYISFRNIDMKKSKRQRVYFMVTERSSVSFITHTPTWNINVRQQDQTLSAYAPSVVNHVLEFCEGFASFRRKQDQRRKEAYMQVPFTFIANVSTPFNSSNLTRGGMVDNSSSSSSSCYRFNVGIVQIKFVRLGTVCSMCGGKLQLRGPALRPDARGKVGHEHELVCEYGCSSPDTQVRIARKLLSSYPACLTSLFWTLT
jgi:hypothetical protein